MPRDPEREVQSAEAFAAAYRLLSEAEVRRLANVARAFGRRCGMDGDDIQQSALVAVLDGRRHWPTDMTLVSFLAGVMRSVASAENQRNSRSEVRRPVSLFDPDAGVGDLVDERPSVEEVMLVSEKLHIFINKLMVRCEGDDAASLIVMGLMDGLDGHSLQEATGLDQTAFNTKRRWVRRQIDACLAQGKNDE